MHLNLPSTMIPILLQSASHSAILREGREREREREEEKEGGGQHVMYNVSITQHSTYEM